MTHKDHPVNDYAAAVGSVGQLIDVRQPEEVALGTLPGATNIPLDELPGRLNELDQSRCVVVVCGSGVRSTKASELLTGAGFGDVVNLEGGMKSYEPSEGNR